MLHAPEQENNQISLNIYTLLGTDSAFDWSHSCVTDTTTWQELVCRTLARISETLLNSSHTPPKENQQKERNIGQWYKNSIHRINYVFKLLLCNHLLSLLPLFSCHLKRVKKLGEERNTQDLFMDWQEYRTSWLTEVNYWPKNIKEWHYEALKSPLSKRHVISQFYKQGAMFQSQPSPRFSIWPLLSRSLVPLKCFL